MARNDCGRIGASPDGLIVGARGGLEIKCTLDETHMGILIDGLLSRLERATGRWYGA